MIRKRIDPLRFVAATMLLVAGCAGLIVLVRSAPRGPVGVAMIVIAGAAFTLVPASIFEWLVHRYIYHRPRGGPLGQIFRIHHQGHHAAIFPTWRYVTNGTVRRHPITEPDVSHLYPAGWRNLISKAAHFAWYMGLATITIWTPAWLATHDRLFVASIIVTTAIISDLFVRVHDAIHYPGQFRVIEAQPWFAFLDRHHFIHHVDIEANVNFLLPLGDWCYGTLRTRLTAEEIARHGTLEEPKANPVGESEPAARVARERRARRGERQSSARDQADAGAPLARTIG